MAPPAGVAEDCGEDDEEQDAHPEDRDEEAAAVVAVALLAHHLLRALFGGFERELHLLADRIGARDDPARPDRKSVVSGKSVSVRVDLGGRRIIKKKTNKKNRSHTNTLYK